MQEALQKLHRDDNVRVVILASGVPGVFCAGADLKERANLTEAEVKKQSEFHSKPTQTVVAIFS